MKGNRYGSGVGSSICTREFPGNGARPEDVSIVVNVGTAVFQKKGGMGRSPCPCIESISAVPAYLKFAVSERFAFMVTVMVCALLVTLPDQPIQGEPASGVAVSVTTVPGA